MIKKSFIDKLISSFKKEKTIELSNGEIASLADINTEKYNNKNSEVAQKETTTDTLHLIKDAVMEKMVTYLRFNKIHVLDVLSIEYNFNNVTTISSKEHYIVTCSYITEHDGEKIGKYLVRIDDFGKYIKDFNVITIL